MSVDPEIEKILTEPDGASARDRVELAVGITERVTIAGREFPAPSAAVFALLETIRSPFVSGDDLPDDAFAGMAVFRALYVLSAREKAVAPILQWQRRRDALESLQKKIAGDNSPQTVLILAELIRQEATAEAHFDAAALAFADTLGAFSVTEAVQDIMFYLSLAGGFVLLPNSDEQGVKKNEPTTSSGSLPFGRWLQRLFRR